MREVRADRRWTGSQLLTALVLVLGAGAALVNVASGDEKLSQTELAARGAVTFRVYCQNCHGAKGKGDGVLAELLKVTPSDLTVLAKNHDGEYPADQVRAAIDGREEVKGHGRREMPIWGYAFKSEGGDAEEEEAKAERKIDEVVAYLQTIQVK